MIGWKGGWETRIGQRYKSERKGVKRALDAYHRSFDSADLKEFSGIEKVGRVFFPLRDHTTGRFGFSTVISF